MLVAPYRAVGLGSRGFCKRCGQISPGSNMATIVFVEFETNALSSWDESDENTGCLGSDIVLSFIKVV